MIFRKLSLHKDEATKRVCDCMSRKKAAGGRPLEDSLDCLQGADSARK